MSPDEPRRIAEELRRRKHPALKWWRFGYGLLCLGGVGFVVAYVMMSREGRSVRLTTPRDWGFAWMLMASFATMCIAGLMIQLVRERVTRERKGRDDPEGDADRKRSV